MNFVYIYKSWTDLGVTKYDVKITTDVEGPAKGQIDWIVQLRFFALPTYFQSQLAH